MDAGLQHSENSDSLLPSALYSCEMKILKKERNNVRKHELHAVQCSPT